MSAQFPFPNEKRQPGLPAPGLPSPATVWGCLNDIDEQREIGESGEGGSLEVQVVQAPFPEEARKQGG